MTSPHARSGLRVPLLGLTFVLTVCVAPALAHSATVTITFSGTVTSAFGDLGGVLSGGETITGTVELDDTIVGTFTPGTVFSRAEMLYTGAILSTSLVVDGSPVSGTGGDLEIFDSDGPLNGDDSYEATGVIDTGTVAGVVLASGKFSPAYDDPAFTVETSTPLFGPPPIDPASANRIRLTSATGGTASANLESFSFSPQPNPAPVPVLSPFGLGVAVLALAGVGARRLRRATSA